MTIVHIVYGVNWHQDADLSLRQLKKKIQIFNNFSFSDVITTLLQTSMFGDIAEASHIDTFYRLSLQKYIKIDESMN